MDYAQAQAFITELTPAYMQDAEMAHARLREATTAALSGADPEVALLLLDELCWQATIRFDADEALPWIQRLMELAEAFGKHHWIGCANNTYGVFFVKAGDPLAAIDRLIPALEAFESAGNQARAASVLANIGELLVDMGETERAGIYLEESERLGEEAMAARSQGVGTVAGAATSGTAVAGSTDAASIAGDPRPELHINMVYVLVARGEMAQAWQRVVRIWREGRTQPGWEMRGRAHELAGWIRYQEGALAPAVRHLHRAISHYQTYRDPYRATFAWLLLGDIHLGQEARAKAAEAYGQAAEISGALGYRKLEIEALRKLLPVTASPLEGLAAQRRLVEAMRQADACTRHMRQQFVDIRIRSEAARQERIRLERDVERDALTGLLSYRRFAERLERMGQDCERYALIFLDVDKLKELNDRWGHAAGDMLLRSFANDLADALPKGGLAFRKSGDEFLVVLPHATRVDVQRYLEDLFARLGVQRRIGEQQLSLSGSAGVSLCPEDAMEPDLLEWMADQAMYRAKAAGRNGWTWHAPMAQG